MGTPGHHEGIISMDDGNSPGAILAPVRPHVSLRCGPFNAHQECKSEFCDCPHHGALIPRREVAGTKGGGSGDR